MIPSALNIPSLTSIPEKDHEKVLRGNASDIYISANKVYIPLIPPHATGSNKSAVNSK